MYIVLDLYCGVGGFSLGFKQEGYKVYGIDINPEYLRVYKKYIGPTIQHDLSKVIYYNEEDYHGELGVKNSDSIMALNWKFEKIGLRGNIDVIIGGSPCEPFSRVNTLRRMEDHPLFPTMPNFFFMVWEILPKVFIYENVPEVARSPYFWYWIEELRYSIYTKTGYDIIIGIVDYSKYGIPLKRRRLFVIGSRTGFDGFNLSSMREHPPNLKQVIGDLVDHGYDFYIDHVWPRANTEVPKRRRVWKDYWNFDYFGRKLKWNELPSGLVNISKAYIMHPSHDRLLSVRETMRIFTFPDDFRILNLISSLKNKYQAVIQAVPPKFSRKLAKAIIQLLKRDPHDREEGNLVILDSWIKGLYNEIDWDKFLSLHA